MTAYDRAREFYRGFEGYDLDRDILHFSRRGHVYITPVYILLATTWAEHQSWHIYFAIGRGCLQDFFNLMPYEMPHITYYRPTKHGVTLQKHRSSDLQRLCTAYSNTSMKISYADLGEEVPVVPLHHPDLPPLLTLQEQVLKPRPMQPVAEDTARLSSRLP